MRHLIDHEEAAERQNLTPTCADHNPHIVIAGLDPAYGTPEAMGEHQCRLWCGLEEWHSGRWPKSRTQFAPKRGQPMLSERIASLKRTGLLAGLSEVELAALAPRCHWKSVTAGELIIGHLDQSRDVLFLVDGLARASVYSLAGRQVSFRDIRPGDVVGELSAIDGRARSASVESLVASTFMVMPQAVFQDVLQSHPAVLFATLRHLTTQVRALTDRVFEFSTLAVRNRVHAEIVRLAREAASDQGGADAVIRPAPTHTEIASRISTHREAVTRELNRLEGLGIISREGRTLRVNNLARLEAMVEDFSPD